MLQRTKRHLIKGTLYVQKIAAGMGEWGWSWGLGLAGCESSSACKWLVSLHSHAGDQVRQVGQRESKWFQRGRARNLSMVRRKSFAEAQLLVSK